MSARKGFIAFEGIDGAGKSTQIDLLARKLESQGITTKVLHFPRTEEPVVGELVAMFLRGELGGLDTVHPRLVALMFGVDRLMAREELEELIEKGIFVISDRYTYSNIAFQAAKLKNKQEKERLCRWIEELEFGRFRIPKPDLSLYLRVPSSHILDVLGSDRRTRDRDRTYLLGKADIHEASLKLQRSVSEEYEALCKTHSDLVPIECESQLGILVEPETICDQIYQVLAAAGLPQRA